MGNHVKLVSAGMGSALAMATGGLTLLTGALAGFVSVHGILEATDALDALGDSATKIGIGTEELAGLRHAANLTGVDAESLDKALLKMQQNLSKAATEGGAVKDVLSDLKLDAVAVKASGASNAVVSILRAMDGVPDAAKKVDMMREVFGKAGADLIPLVAESGELGERIKEAAEIGLTATQAQVASVGAANDAIDTMKGAFKGLFRTVSIAIAPFVQEFADGVTNAIKYMNSYRDSVTSVFREVQFVLENFGEYWDLTFETAFYKLTKWYNNVENFFINALPRMFMEGVNLAFPAFDTLGVYIAYTFTKIINEIEHFFEEWGQVMERLVSFDFKGAGEAFDEAVKGGKDRIEGDIEKMFRQDLEGSARRLNKLMGDAGKRIGESFNRAEGPIEEAMRQSVEGKARQLEDRMNKFVAEKMALLKANKKKAGGEEITAGEAKPENKAVERGSQEALKLIAKKDNDEALAAMNKQLAETKKHTELLAKIAGKRGLARGII